MISHEEIEDKFELCTDPWMAQVLKDLELGKSILRQGLGKVAFASLFLRTSSA
jgi:hypothetical protein